jgi:hypothetical protein
MQEFLFDLFNKPSISESLRESVYQLIGLCGDCFDGDRDFQMMVHALLKDMDLECAFRALCFLVKGQSKVAEFIANELSSLMDIPVEKFLLLMLNIAKHKQLISILVNHLDTIVSTLDNPECTKTCFRILTKISKTGFGRDAVFSQTDLFKRIGVTSVKAPLALLMILSQHEPEKTIRLLTTDDAQSLLFSALESNQRLIIEVGIEICRNLCQCEFGCNFVMETGLLDRLLENVSSYGFDSWSGAFLTICSVMCVAPEETLKRVDIDEFLEHLCVLLGISDDEERLLILKTVQTVMLLNDGPAILGRCSSLIEALNDISNLKGGLAVLARYVADKLSDQA